MAPTTLAGLVVLCVSSAMAAGGGLAVQKARAMPAPVEPERRVLAGTVSSVAAVRCGRAGVRTCYRLAARYDDGGQVLEVSSRGAINPSPHRVGDPVAVFAVADDGAWLEYEWHNRQEQRRRDFESARRSPLVMGWWSAGLGGFGVLLGLGLIFFVDRSG